MMTTTITTSTNALLFFVYIISILINSSFVVVNGASHCGLNFEEAKSNCEAGIKSCTNIPTDNVNCDEGEWCFGGPSFVCGPPPDDDDAEEVVEVTEDEATVIVTEQQVATTVNDSQTLTAMLLEAEETSTSNTPSPPTTDPLLSTTIEPTNSTTTAAPTEVPTESTPVPSYSPITTTYTPTSTPTTLNMKMAEERRNITNPANHYCGSDYTHAKNECNDNVYAVPCPLGSETPCPDDLFCYSIATECVPQTFEPSSSPTLQPTTYEPTTMGPSSSPISKDDVMNLYYCGTNEQTANECNGNWCRTGLDSDCPEDQSCYLTSQCNATLFNYTVTPTSSNAPSMPMPSGSPTTTSPTEDLNPGNWYCANEWRDSSWDGECGVPCPRYVSVCLLSVICVFHS